MVSVRPRGSSEGEFKDASPAPESAATIRDRGAAGALLLTLRAAGAQAVGFIGMLVLVHLLSPTALGMVAFGTTIVTIGNFFADGGLGAALIRRGDHPTVDELRALLGFQLILAVVIALGVTVVGFQAGTTGAVTAIMAWSLPLLALRAPHAIALERALDYRPIAATDFAESVVYYAWAIAMVAAGWGVWGVASAAIARAVTGSVADDRRVATEGDHAAAGAWHAALDAGLRGRLPGGRAGSIGERAGGQPGDCRRGRRAVAWLLVGCIPAVAGAVLGVPGVVAGVVPDDGAAAGPRRGHPSHSGTLRPCNRPPLRRNAGATRRLGPYCRPSLARHELGPVRSPPAVGSAGLVIAGPISVATAGYLYSEKDVRTPLVATVINGAVWIGLTAILLPTLGVAAVGIAWMVASWTEAAIFSRALHRAGVAVGRMIIVPVAAAVASALLAYATQTPLPTSLVPGITTAAVALAAYLALSYAFNRPDLLATARRVRSLT